MPPGDYENDRLIVKAVQEGKLDESVVDQACERILNIIFRYTENRDEKAVFDYEKDHKAAAEIEAECMVLLKNENEILPLTSDKKIAFIGKYAKTPRYQGGGSSHINSWKVESALEAAKEIQELANVTFAEGYQDEKDEVVEALQSEAVKAAAEADVAVLFLGLPDNFESEGYDRKHMNLPNCQNELVEKVLEVQKHVVVVLLTYGKGFDNAVYQEGVFVGYRYYTSRKMETAFPFGYGLSYTTFAYSDLQLDKKEMSDKEHVEVSVKVKNTGKCAGKTVVQLYVGAPETEVVRPVRELRGFEKIFLEAGEEKTVTFILGERAFAYWNTLIHDWYAEEGTYKVMIGENADHMCVGEEITVHPTKELPKTYSLNTCLGELMRDPKAQTVMAPFMQGMAQNDVAMDMAEANENDQSGVVNQEMMAAMMEGMPLRQLLSFVPGIKREMLEQMVNTLNQL